MSEVQTFLALCRRDPAAVCPVKVLFREFNASLPAGSVGNLSRSNFLMELARAGFTSRDRQHATGTTKSVSANLRILALQLDQFASPAFDSKPVRRTQRTIQNVEKSSPGHLLLHQVPRVRLNTTHSGHAAARQSTRSCTSASSASSRCMSISSRGCCRRLAG